jgi:hypothetical protein
MLQDKHQGLIATLCEGILAGIDMPKERHQQGLLIDTGSSLLLKYRAFHNVLRDYKHL